MKYIVIGGAGFIGSHIVEKLVQEKRKVLIIDNLSTGNYENIQPFISNITFVRGNIQDKDLLEEHIEEGDIIFHLAALPSVTRSVNNPLSTNENNIKGTLNVLLAAKEKKADRVIFSSSSSVYGDSETLPKIETMTPNPKSPYALSKLTGEYYMKLFYELYGLKTISLRYFNVFGPRQDPNSEYSAVIPRFIKQISENKTPIIYGDGEQTRDFTYVTNVVSANLLASNSKKGFGETINIACGSRLSLNELVEKINNILGKKATPKYEETRKGDVQHSLAGITKAKDILEYASKIDFEEGLKLTIESMRRH